MNICIKYVYVCVYVILLRSLQMYVYKGRMTTETKRYTWQQPEYSVVNCQSQHMIYCQWSTDMCSLFFRGTYSNGNT